MAVDIEQIDPHNEPALRAWWEVGRAATAERPGNPWPAWEHSRRALPAENPERSIVLLGAIDDRRMVGAAMLILYLHDNPHAASLDVFVAPERQREGIGSGLVVELESLAAGHGRTTKLSEAFVPPGGTGPGEHFARHHGFEVANREAIRELTRAHYAERRAGCVAAIGDRAVDYDLVTFDTVCPEEYVESYGRLLGMLMAEIPLGDLDLADSEWTRERLRAAEQRNAVTRRHLLTALAIAPDGSVAGSSDVRVNDAEPTHGQVGVTLVDPQHRGHRLGLALKIATHDLTLAAYADLVSLDTSNAEVNAHMFAVNDALGYRTVETLLELQKKTS